MNGFWQISGLILESSVSTIFISKIWDLWRENKQEEREREESLYGQLRLFLTFTEINEKQRDLVMERGTENLKRLELIPQSEKDSFTDNHFSTQSSIITPLINNWWSYIDTIVGLLRANAGSIKKEHLDAVKDFFEGYMAREWMGKNVHDSPKWVFMGEDANELTNKISKSLKNLRELII